MEKTMPRLREHLFVTSALAGALATGLAQRKRINRFTFASDESGLILIDAETQAEAEAKLLAEPALLDLTDPGCASPAVAYNAEPTFCCERRENE